MTNILYKTIKINNLRRLKDDSIKLIANTTVILNPHTVILNPYTVILNLFQDLLPTVRTPGRFQPSLE